MELFIKTHNNVELTKLVVYKLEELGYHRDGWDDTSITAANGFPGVQTGDQAHEDNGRIWQGFNHARGNQVQITIEELFSNPDKYRYKKKKNVLSNGIEIENVTQYGFEVDTHGSYTKEFVEALHFIVSQQGWEINYSGNNSKIIQIGCKTFTLKDIETILELMKKA